MSAPPAEGLQILVVEDDAAHADVIADVLEGQGHSVSVAGSGREALEALERDRVDLVVTDLRLTDKDGQEIVERCRELRGDHAVPQCVVVTGYGTVDGAVAAMGAGALHYLQKPLDIAILRETVRAASARIALEVENRELHTAIDKAFAFPGIFGQTRTMHRIFDVMNQIVDTDATVLVQGESGTGKELIAHALHNAGPRRNRPFIPLNCAALAEGVLESELFGHEQGAFTGATAQRKGRFEAADGGTLFLDEIGDMPLSTQAHLLRALESGEIVRVGSNDPIQVDVRVVAATNRDLDAMVREGSFREDLCFRLRVVQLDLPPLRERLADLPHLAEHFLAEAATRHSRPGKSFSPEALDLLMGYRWPGNVRELKNAVESMVLLSREATIPPEVVPAYVRPAGDRPDVLGSLSGLPLDDVERALITNTLRDVGGNRERASQMLGISTRTLYRKIKAYGLSRSSERAKAAGSE
ncbi:MAG: sigma-54 dependent transcriptional regulator [Planctomycetota bacterium]|nr:sigma-54 dependent transcriptional regulator [Planctomycetota bacterium]